MTAPNLEQVIADHADFIDSKGHRICTCGGWRSESQDRHSRSEFAAHVVAAIRDSGYTVIAHEEAVTEYGVEASLLIDGGREVQGPMPLDLCETRIERQRGKSWADDGRPLDPVLVQRTVIATPWTPAQGDTP